jgi:hypothetical protein
MRRTLRAHEIGLSAELFLDQAAMRMPRLLERETVLGDREEQCEDEDPENLSIGRGHRDRLSARSRRVRNALIVPLII